jgi:ABC-type multidrug transport system fused ATPase/permease subunit
MSYLEQVFYLVGLSLVTASISWTVTQEEIFREPREYCVDRSRTGRSILIRKFFYVFTCEYCFSHWVTLFLLILTDFRFLYPDLRGALFAFFVIPWIANQWMSLYRRVRVEIKHENILATKAKKQAGLKEDKEK